MSEQQPRFEPDGDPIGRAVLLPGRNYPPDLPLLHFSMRALLQRQWSVRQVWWQASAVDDSTETADWVTAQLLAAVGDEAVDLVVAKSLGCYAAPYAASSALPAIWLTPVLTDPLVADALLANDARQLVVIGSADPYLDDAVVRTLAERPSVEVWVTPSADHALAVPGDVAQSVRLLGELVERVVGWV